MYTYTLLTMRLSHSLPCPRAFFLYPFAGVLFLRRLCTSAPNSRVKDYRSANARLRYSTSRKTFGALSASDNKPAAFGEIDSAANESRLFTNHRDDGSMEKNWYWGDLFFVFFFFAREKKSVASSDFSLDRCSELQSFASHERWQNSDTKKVSLVRVHPRINLAQKCSCRPIIGCRGTLARAKGSRTGLAGSGRSPGKRIR